MKDNIRSFTRAVNSFSKLPGVGSKTAQRYAYKIINMTEEQVDDFAKSLIEVKKNIKFCETCFNWTEEKMCEICKNRKHSIICVVKEPKDIIAFEKIKNFDGVYHVLHGVLSPMNGINEENIKAKELLYRLKGNGVKEVIMATNPDIEGEATAMYLSSLIKPLGIKVTRIAQGVSIGSDLEYADEVTLSKALEDRKDF